MRAPGPKRPDDIVDRIVCEITDALPENETPEAEAIRVAVMASVNLLRAIEGFPLRGYRADNVAALKAARKSLRTAQRDFARIPRAELTRMVIDDDRDIPDDASQGRAVKRVKNAASFFATLIALYDRRIKKAVGDHGGAELNKRYAAEEAFRLLSLHNIKPAGGKSDSIFGAVASLLFEAMTGRQADLESWCQDAMKTPPASDGTVDKTIRKLPPSGPLPELE